MLDAERRLQVESCRFERCTLEVVLTMSCYLQVYLMVVVAASFRILLTSYSLLLFGADC